MGSYFVAFHKAFKPCMPQVSNDSIYNTLFAWAYSNDNSGFKIDPGQIGRWICGDEALPQKLLLPAVNNVKTTIEMYEEIFSNLLFKTYHFSEEIDNLLYGNMLRLLEAYPIPLFDTGKEEYLLVSYAFVTALVYDELSSGDKYIETRIRKQINASLKQCMHDHKLFCTPYLLNILLDDQHPLLAYALNRIQPGLGFKWQQKIRDYIAKPEHKPYTATSLSKQELLFYAKLLAFNDHQIDSNYSVTATEADICRAIVRCKDTKTILKLQSEMRDYAKDYSAWDCLIEECRLKLGKTTTII